MLIASLLFFPGRDLFAQFFYWLFQGNVHWTYFTIVNNASKKGDDAAHDALSKNIKTKLKLEVIIKMHKLLLSLCLICLSISAHAEKIGKEGIPTNIMDQIYKKHPNALDFTAEKKSHFSQELLKILYKEGEEKFVDYYHPDGHFFVSGLIIAADDLMFTDSKEKLKADFKDYHVKQAVLVVNPNGAGEEFDVLLETGGKSWNVLIDKKGNLAKTEAE